MLTEGPVTASVFDQFLKSLMDHASAPIFLVVDGHPVHRAKIVTGFTQEQNGRLEWHFLLAHSPELTPDEFVCNDLKTHTLGRR